MFDRILFVRLLSFILAVGLGVGGALVGARAQKEQQQQQGTSWQQQQTQQPTPRPAPARPADDTTTLDEDEIERVDTSLTNVIFTAVDKNKRFITNLKQEDIRVLEDGVPQQIFTFQPQTDLPLTLAIVIDTSISQERTLPEEKAAARAFVDAVMRPAKDEVAVLSFTGDSTLEQGLTGNAVRVRSAIERVEFVPPSGYIGRGVTVGGTPPISGDNQSTAGSTAIWDAVYATCHEVMVDSSDKTRRAIVLLTDGDDTSSMLKLDEAVQEALKTDTLVFAIGIGDSFGYSGVDEGSLRKVTERTGGRAYFPRSEEDLRNAFAQIQRELREQFLVAYSPTNKRRDGSYRKLQIEIVNPELRKQNVKLNYRQGYFAKSDSAPATRRRK
ncbi:MAG TPA: VWA domain-containing protein [Pyrinomonadaceae bacterium]|jgi:VWFA-related protein|nr:VWA domain-containing protein [Pyrinomonadaceae bacterium]